MLQNLEKSYLSIPELAKRWRCDVSEVCALIWRGQLIPSWYFNEYDPYPIYELTADEETNGLTGEPVEGQVAGFEEITKILFRQDGFQYLILPKRTSPTTCDFWLFSSVTGPFSVGDCVQHLPSPISLLDVKERGIVMVSEVEKCEKLLCAPDPLATQPHQITPISRSMAQDAFVLKSIEKMGLNPLELPKFHPGKAGIKAKICQEAILEKKIFISKRVFEKVWERLTSRRDIAYKK